MPVLQTLVNTMLDEFDRRCGSDIDRSILISLAVRAEPPSHGSRAQLHQTRASIAVQARYRGAIVDSVPHDREWLVAVVPVVLDEAAPAVPTLCGDGRTGRITEHFDELDVA